MKILVLGVSGMLGNAMIRYLSMSPEHKVYGSARDDKIRSRFSDTIAQRIITGIDLEDDEAVEKLFTQVEPEVVINCIGLVKQLEEANNPILAISINALLPHKLAVKSQQWHARFIHFSTDCVFSGKSGMYRESDNPDAQDLYGRTKLLGEVDYPHAITLRTSIIGHELNSAHGLVGWFLSQHGHVKGYTHAIFSGLPTCEIAKVINDHVLMHPNMHGTYQVAASPISKFDLLNLVNEAYGKGIVIEPDSGLKMDRSLDGGRFEAETGYKAAPWPELVSKMKAFG